MKLDFAKVIDCTGKLKRLLGVIWIEFHGDLELVVLVNTQNVGLILRREGAVYKLSVWICMTCGASSGVVETLTRWFVMCKWNGNSADYATLVCRTELRERHAEMLLTENLTMSDFGRKPEVTVYFKSIDENIINLHRSTFGYSSSSLSSSIPCSIFCWGTHKVCHIAPPLLTYLAPLGLQTTFNDEWRWSTIQKQRHWYSFYNRTGARDRDNYLDIWG